MCRDHHGTLDHRSEYLIPSTFVHSLSSSSYSTPNIRLLTTFARYFDPNHLSQSQFAPPTLKQLCTIASSDTSQTPTSRTMVFGLGSKKTEVHYHSFPSKYYDSRALMESKLNNLYLDRALYHAETQAEWEYNKSRRVLNKAKDRVRKEGKAEGYAEGREEGIKEAQNLQNIYEAGRASAGSQRSSQRGSTVHSGSTVRSSRGSRALMAAPAAPSPLGQRQLEAPPFRYSSRADRADEFLEHKTRSSQLSRSSRSVRPPPPSEVSRSSRSSRTVRPPPPSHGPSSQVAPTSIGGPRLG